MKNKNILLIFGNAIGNGGDIRFAMDLYNYLKKDNNVKMIFNVSRNKKMVKLNPHNMNHDDAIYFDFKTEYDGELNCDLCVITSVPNKNRDKDIVKENFINLLKKIECKKIYLEVGRLYTCHRCNIYSDERYRSDFFGNINSIVSHTNNGLFNKYLQKHNIDVPLKESLLVATDYDKLSRSIERLPKINSLVYFVGRPCVYKGLYKILDLHRDWLIKNNFCTVLEGGNMGPRMHNTVLADKETVTPHSHISLNLYGKYPYNFTNFGGPLQFNGEYNRMEMLSRMSQAKFGCFFSSITKSDEGGPFEYTFNEIVCCGAVPIILKEFYDNAHINRFYINNINPKDMGILIYDINNPQQLINEMIQIDNNDELFNEYINNAYTFFKSKLDANIILDNLVKQF